MTEAEEQLWTHTPANVQTHTTIGHASSIFAVMSNPPIAHGSMAKGKNLTMEFFLS